MKKLCTFLVTMMVTMMLLTSVADAKGGGGGRGGSFGGRSSGGFSGSSRSISVRSASTSTSSVRISNTAAAAKPASAAKPAAIKVSRDSVISGLNGKGAKGDAAGVLYKDFQTRQANPIKPNMKLDKGQIDTIFSPSYRQNRRSDYYGSYHPTPSTHYRETVHVNHSGGYGIWDYMMFDSIMDNVGDRQMYYHHQSDPAFQDWRRDANAACAAGDKDVCEKLADLDKEMDEYKAKGVKQNPNYITPGVDPDIYESGKIDPKTLAEIKVCTGSLGSDYNDYVADIGRVTKLKVTPIRSNGSADNALKLAHGECDMAFLQDDLSAASSNLIKVVTPNQLEVGFLLCPKESGVKHADDLSDKQTIFVGSDQTGSQFTLDQLRDHIPSLAKPKVDHTHPTMEAVGQIKGSKDGCLFAVSTPDYAGFKELDNSGKFIGIPLFTKDFKGSPNYKLVNVDVGHYHNLTQDEYKSFGWGNPGGTDTVAVSTSLVTSQSWIDQNRQLYDLLMLERQNLQVSIQ